MCRNCTAAGSPLPPVDKLKSDPAFMRRFRKHILAGPFEGDCWEWTAKVSRDGYGYVSIGNLRLKAHRVSFALHHGFYPDNEKQICHTCDNRACINPDHLREGTAEENTADRCRRFGYQQRSAPPLDLDAPPRVRRFRWKNQHGRG